MKRFFALLLPTLLAISLQEAAAQNCYSANYKKAETLFQQGDYSAAIKRYRAALVCPDKPAGNDVDTRINECNRRLQKQAGNTRPSGNAVVSCDTVTLNSVTDEIRIATVQETPKQEPVFEIVETMPEFPGGNVALLQFISANLRYPSAAVENGVQGRVVVKFVVKKDGSVGEVKVLRGVDYNLDKEAIRVCKMLPKFSPGKQNGQAVNTWYTLPITFRL